MLNIVPFAVAYPKKNVTKNILTNSLAENKFTTPLTPSPVIVTPKINAKPMAINPAFIFNFLPPSTEINIATINNINFTYVIK